MDVKSTEFGIAAAQGFLNGITLITKMGTVGTVVATEQDVWAVGGKYVFPTAKMQMEVVSSSGDDAAAGTGAQTVIVGYLDESLVEKTETVTLNGATAVPTVATNIFRINYFRVATAGTGLVAAGNIDIRHVDNTPIYSRIATGQTRARNAMYTVPKGKKLYLKQITYASTSAGENPARFSLRSNYNELSGAVETIQYPYSEIGIQNAPFSISYDLPQTFPEGSDIRISAISVANANATCSSQWRGWLQSV